MEVETHLTLSVRLGLSTQDQADAAWQKSQSVGRMLTNLIASLRAKDAQSPDPKP